MSNDILAPLIVGMFIALVLTMKNMAAEFQPQYRKGCTECTRVQKDLREMEERQRTQLREKEEQRLAEVRKNYETTTNRREEKDDIDPGGGWKT